MLRFIEVRTSRREELVDIGPGLTLIVQEGDLVLGTWQGVLLAEWDGPRTRRVAVKFSS